MIKSSLNEITSASYLIDNMLGAVTGLISGFISTKIAVDSSHNLFRKNQGFIPLVWLYEPDYKAPWNFENNRTIYRKYFS